MAHGACVAKERGLGFVKKRGHFCLIKTYVFWLNLDGLIDSLCSTNPKVSPSNPKA